MSRSTVGAVMKIAALVLVACFGVLLFLHAQSDRERISVLGAWREQHQKSDDDQFRMIDALAKQLAGSDLKNENRITTLEANYKTVKSDLDSLASKLWILICGVASLLLEMASRLLVRLWRPETHQRRRRGES